MSTISRKTTTLIVGAGVAILVGVMLTFSPSWLVDIKDDAAAVTVDEVSATDAAETLTWPDPAHEPRARTKRPLLELVGVIAGTGGGIAMIREKGGTTQTYQIGDPVVGNRELVEIHETHVLLRNEERLERLRIRGRSPQKYADPEELREFAEQLTTRPGAADDPPPD
jgi:hypothetical protein